MMRFSFQFLLCLWATGATAQQCEEIRFAAGSSSATIRGSVIENNPMCLRFSAGAGQLAQLDLTGSDNACFTIEDVVDCRDTFSFRTDRKTYQFRIFQLFARRSAEQVSLTLTIR